MCLTEDCVCVWGCLCVCTRVCIMLILIYGLFYLMNGEWEAQRIK
jgi:hypothetical protein